MLLKKNHRVDRFTIWNYYHKISKYSYYIAFPSSDFFSTTYIFNSIYFIIQYNIELIFADISIIEYWFFPDVEHFFSRIAPSVSIPHPTTGYLDEIFRENVNVLKNSLLKMSILSSLIENSLNIKTYSDIFGMEISYL
jgi:hypothetical protein